MGPRSMLRCNGATSENHGLVFVFRHHYSVAAHEREVTVLPLRHDLDYQKPEHGLVRTSRYSAS